MNPKTVPALLCVVFTLFQHQVWSLTLKDYIEIISRNKLCSAVPSPKDFSLEQFVGTWYASYQVNPLLKSDPPCSTFDIGFNSNDTLSLRMTNRIFIGMVLQGVGSGTTPDSFNEPAVMLWKWNFAPDTEDTMKVIETDYENYAVVIACNGLGQSSGGFLFSRHQVVPPAYLRRGKEVLGSYVDLSRGFLMQTEYCHLSPLKPDDAVLKFGDIDMEKMFQTLFSKR